MVLPVSCHVSWRTWAIILMMAMVMRSRQAHAQETAPILWTTGPAVVDLGGTATLQLPAGFRFLGADDVRRWVELNGNMPDPTEIGVVTPSSTDDSGNPSWFILFSFDGTGYVKDDGRELLDGPAADAMLDSIRTATAQGKEERRVHGWPDLNVVGWEERPFYDNSTHNLTWALRGRSVDGDIVNYNSRLLGRNGFMSVNLVLRPELLPATVPTYRYLTSNIAFNSGLKYEEFRRGDKVADYTLATLVTGGVAVATIKLWKPLIAVGAAVLALFGAAGHKVKAFFGAAKRRHNKRDHRHCRHGT